MKRRDLLKTGAAAGLGALIPSALTGCTPAAASAAPAVGSAAGNGRRGPVRNIIFYVYDGTGYEDLAAARFFSERVLNRPLLLQELMGRGAAGSMFPHSLTSIVTDSAAASSVWAVGRKVVNGAMSMYPDGTRLTTIMQLAKDRGMATGLVTSTRITHATPGAWIARVPSRAMEDEIAEQYLEFEPDVLLGGGSAPFDAAEREDGRDLFAEFRAKGYDILRTREDLRRSNGSRLLGTFTPGMEHLAYEIDRRYQGAPSPSLADVTRKGLEVLGGSESGFLLQVEAGRIDHANHINDPGAMIWDWMAADEALQPILEFVDGRDDTQLIFVPDHDTGSNAIYGYGSGYALTTPAFEALSRRRASQPWMVDELGDRPSAGDLRDGVREYLGFEATPEQVERLVHLFHEGVHAGHPTAHGGLQTSLNWILSEIPRGATDRPPIVYGTRGHTAGVVPLARYGAGVAPGNLGIVDNTELFYWMTEMLGIDFENPEMTEAEALQHLAGAVQEPVPMA
jgi:alkaline phosphatase